MKKIICIVSLLAAAVLFEPGQSAAVQMAVNVDFSALGPALQIAAKTMPSQAFFGKHIVMPVEVSRKSVNGSNTGNLQARLTYQLLDASGSKIGQSASIPVALNPNPYKPDILIGSAFIPRQNFSAVRNGGAIAYRFELMLNGNLYSATKTSTTTFVNQNQWAAIIPADGGVVSLPDTSVTDAPTTFNFPNGAFDQSAVLTIQGLDPDSSVTFQGQSPVVEYALSMSAGTLPSGRNVLSWNPSVSNLSGMVVTPLSRPYQIVLSYPANPDGTVPIDFSGHSTAPSNLAPYFYDPVRGWVLAARPNLNTTLHTISFTATTLQTYALFATGSVSANDIRPVTRTLTPNGDGINDTVTFIGLVDGEQVHLFDMRGRRVATLNGPNPIWAAKDDDGHVVESGIYIYQYTSQGIRVSGVINVVK